MPLSANRRRCYCYTFIFLITHSFLRSHVTVYHSGSLTVRLCLARCTTCATPDKYKVIDVKLAKLQNFITGKNTFILYNTRKQFFITIDTATIINKMSFH